MKKIFLADDDADDAEIFLEALHRACPTVSFKRFEHGKKLLEHLHANKTQLPDIIFLDLNMPRMNGREFLSKFKKEKIYRDIPVIIWTTSAAQKDIDETTALGASYYLIKPNRFEELCNQIKLVMEIDWKRPAEWTDAKAGLK